MCDAAVRSGRSGSAPRGASGSAAPAPMPTATDRPAFSPNGTDCLAMFSDSDHTAMELALALAARGMFTTTPNPRVGCVLMKHGEIIGQGYTQPAGQDHAEIQAMKDALSRGHDPAGSTAYVTLEPCSHFGRTP